MARKIGLSIYGLSVFDNNNKRICLNDLKDGKSIIDVIKTYIINNQTKYSQNPVKEVLFRFDKVEDELIENNKGQKNYKVLYGRVKTGEYGVESELVNVVTGKIYNKTAEEADMMPFGFCIGVSEGEVTNAVIALQTNGVFGMKLSLQEHLQKCMAELDPDFRISFKPVAPKEYIDRYFNKGILKKIRMVRHEIPEEITERMGINYGTRQTKEERIIHKPLGFLERNKKKVQEWRAGQRSYTKLVELDDFEYDEIKLEFSLEGEDKTFNLGNMEKLVVNENITKKVVLSGGHPTFDSLTPVMKDIVKEYLIGMGLIVMKEG